MKRAALAALVVAWMLAAAAPADSEVGIVRSQVSLSPSGPYLFGQHLTADLDLLVDPALVDPETVSARATFGQFQSVVPPARSVTSEGPVARVRYRYRLTCDSLGCAAGLKLREVTFPDAVARYESRAGKALSIAVSWPSVRLVSRIGDALLRPETATEARQQIPIDPLQLLPISVLAPQSTYTTSPRVLAGLLFAAAFLVLMGALVVGRPLVALVFARRGGANAPELSPFDQAVARVEIAARQQPGSPEHRESLALLARELRRVGMPELVGRARRLAWSEEAPTAATSRELANEARALHGDAT